VRTNEPLSQTSQAILAELTRYHAERLHEFEDGARRRRAAGDRDLPASLARAVEQMINPGGLSGAEREWAQETGRLTSNGYDPHRLWVPFGAFQRDLNVAAAGAGGYLIDAVNLPARDILRPWSVVLKGGVTVVEQLSSDAFLPRTSTTTTITWASTETTQATPSTPAVAQAALRPKIAIGVINASRQFMLQADPDAWIRRELLSTAGTIVDVAVLNGSGTSGQPLGILNTTGLSTQSGTSLAWAGVLHMKKLAADANAQDGTVSFIGTTAVRELLEARTKETGGGTYIWADDRVASCPAFATTDMPSATLLSGPMGEVFFGLWGAGMSVEVNPFADFKAGIVAIRVVVSCDLALGCAPTSFTKSTAVS